MLKGLYRCTVIGTGRDGDDFRPKVAEHAGVSWAVSEEFAAGATCVVVEVTATLVAHTAIALDPDIVMLR